ncbi:MAG: hypothetical protein ABF780_05655 [Bifidobacterium aquikefiri]|uniref:Uncharacterized protein n=1 Tax=Bifidobacterium aquikefiri TaxID=1653207 RepID=A0A261G2A4_9BIFI|nr:hypothetical protein [Bifidobacterium aquikefiri]OZG65552.1 hypothetical protein BAQU_1735 [Bifidobacterium aquikefiri]
MENLDWGALYRDVGELVEQNKTLYHKTDDHETRVRIIEGEVVKQRNDVQDLSDKVDVLDGKVDGLSKGVTDLSGQVSGLRESIDNLQGPHARRLKLWQWMCRHANPLMAALLAAIGSGFGGYLLGFIIHS